MRIGILFGTSDGTIINLIGIRKLSFVPNDIKSLIGKKGHSLSFVGHLDFSVSSSVAKICDRIWTALDHCDGVILICCENNVHLAETLREAIFTYECEFPSDRSNLINQLRAILSKAVRRFSEFADRFNDMKHRKLLLLPFGAFEANSLRGLRDLLRAPATASEFSNELHRQLAEMSKLRQPKRGNKRYPDQYIVDGKGWHFSYGKELHGPPDTSIPPHTPVCDLNGEIRFGVRYDRERHFNVSIDGKDARISGDVVNCHGKDVAAKAATHLNIYPNGFLKSETGAA